MPRLARLALLIAAAAGLAACAGLAPPEPPRLPDPACHAERDFAFLETSPNVYRQGAAIALRPMVDLSPAGQDELPPRCTSGWTVSGPARLSADHRTLTIDGAAPVGARIDVGFAWLGRPVTARLTVVARDAVVLTGTRSQRSVAGCDSADPVRELEFGANGRFAVTFQPFETYRDYWGTYAFDAAAGSLRLTVEGGNFVPPGLILQGPATLVEGRLILTGFYLGTRNGAPPPPQGCTYQF
jgi:hypothetical protein